MRRKKWLVLSSTLVAIGGFIGASQAGSRAPDLSSNLPAKGLPTVALAHQTQVAINNLIDAETAARFGIIQDSFAKARRLAQTDAGPLYVLPGTHGACLVLLPSVACAPVGSSNPVVALFVPSPSSEYLVGGGLLTGRAGSVAVNRENGSVTPAHLVTGGFTISQADGIKPSERVSVSVQ